MSNDEAQSSDTHHPPISHTVAVIFGLLSAVGYTMANIALRKVTDTDPIWVNSIKALPTLLGMAPLVMSQWMGNRPLVPRRGTMTHLIVGCLVGQFFGNCAFQYSLGVVGLALAVPICFGTMVIGGAICGRLILGESVSKRTVVAIVILLGATTILSLGSDDSAIRSDLTAWQVALGVIAVAVSGASYAFFGTMVRRSLLRGMTVSSTMFVSGVIGTVALTTIAWQRIGYEGIVATSQHEWGYMITAGLCNLMAFFLLTVALQAVSVVIVNLLNVTQIAMAGIAGVIFFQEEFTPTMFVGVGMTILGLMVLGKRGKARNIARQDADGSIASSASDDSGSS